MAVGLLKRILDKGKPAVAEGRALNEVPVPAHMLA